MIEHQQKTKARRFKRHRIPGYTPEREFADELGVSLDTLRKWRRQGKGPAYIIVGRQIHVGDEDKLVWLKSLRVVPPRSARAA